MKINLIVLLLLILTSCGEHEAQTSNFVKVDCVLSETPKFDFDRVELLDADGNVYKDTLVNKIEKRRHIFKACRDFIYRANLYDKNNSLIMSTKVKLTATGKRWGMQPNKQDQVMMQYEYATEYEEKFKEYNLNKSLKDRRWSDRSETGIIENVERIWIHPFRSNQFITNEVAPFPEVRFPLRRGKTWTSRLTMYEGWGDWENITVTSNYEIVNQSKVDVPFSSLDNCWKVVATSEFSLGKSVLEYWFDEDYGFVKMHYLNYGGQRIEFELEEVIDR